MKTEQPKPVSIRIDPETRAALDSLIARTGLKEAQIIRLAIRELERSSSLRTTRRTPK